MNFYVGFYRQPAEEKNLEWWVTKVVAYDQAGRKVAECQAAAGPGSNADPEGPNSVAIPATGPPPSPKDLG